MGDQYTEEQDELRSLVRRFMQERSASGAVRALIDEGGACGDPAVWRQTAQELGLTAIPIPEEYGGAGYGAVELGIVLEEMGRALFVSPYFATIALAAQTLLASRDEAAKQRWLPAIAEGATRATLAFAEQSGRWTVEDVATTARPDGDAWVLDGTKWFVLDGCSAELILVVARTDAGVGLFAVEADAAGLSRESLEGLDLTRELARLELDGTPAVAIGDGGDAGEWLEEGLVAIYAAAAAEQIGGAARCLEMATDYAKTRVQFERPIGSFQAVKHKCAQMLVDVESGRSAAAYASAAVAQGAPDAPEAASVAKAYCSTAFTNAAKENIQIHGGIGYTWEHDAHLYLRRAKSMELLLGTPAEHRARLAQLIGV
ncbi:MAG: acyl-CoA dehydrogenase family protein [Microbacterium sp.]